jgi:hypothetical protein
MGEPVLQRARRAGRAHGEVDPAALEAQVAADALDDEVDPVELGDAGQAPRGVREVLGPSRP